MISVELKGGLGNQLFQIMATIALSIRSNIPFVLSETKFQDEGTNRPTYWTTLFRNLEPYLNTYFNAKIETGEIQSYKPYYQNDRKYDPIPIPSENILLKGYYQNYQYFDDVYDQILEIMGIREIRQEILSKKENLTDPSGIKISMHFRRGDYCKIQCYHPVLSEHYYMRAMLSILKYLKHDTITPIKVVCFYEKADRDDVLKIVDIVRDITTISGYLNMEYVVDEYHDLADWEQMLVMSACDHHIIANSTFSWWSAYLNPSNKKIVCYPETWLGHQLYYIDTKGFEVPGWHRIPSFGQYERNCNC